MKKLISGLLAASVVICSFTSVFAAAKYSSRGTIIVESDINSNDSEKRASVNRSSKLDITSLFSWASVGNSRASEKKITITSNAGRIEEGTDHPYIPAEVSLRIVNPVSKSGTSYVAEENDMLEPDGNVSVFDYFTLTISDDDGVIYKAENVPSDAAEITIPLGIFNYDRVKNASVYSEKNSYTISLRENSDLDRSKVIDYAYPTRWEWYVDTKQQPDYAYGLPSPTAAVSAAPEMTASPAPEAEPTVAPTAEARPTVTPRVRSTNSPRVRATATPRPTSKPKTSSSSNSAKPTATPKANPKTGDTAPIGALSIVGMLSLAAAVLIQIKRNRNE